MEVPVAEVIGLGALQGITEFLPVSSDGHRALAQLLFGTHEDDVTLRVLLHLGTLLAVVMVLRRRVGRAVYEGARCIGRPLRANDTPGGRDALVVLLATVPSVLMGFALRDLVQHWTRSPLVVGMGFLVTAVVVASTRWATPGDDEWPTWLGAVLIGIAQGLAALPGVSRSGSTIALSLWLGVKPERAFELSMLMSVPALLGAILLELPELSASPAGVPTALVGAAVALVLGIAALLVLRRSVVGGHFALFSLWVFPLAIATLALAKAWPGG